MPEATIDAYQDHGPEYPEILDLAHMAKADRALKQLADLGIDYDDVTDTLEREGVEKFIASFDEMVADIDRKRQALLDEA